MTFYVENETGQQLDFDFETTAIAVAQMALDLIDCPYETETSLLITDNAEIQAYNRENRGIDKATDVLSFPNITFNQIGNFDHVEDQFADCFNPTFF